MEKGRGASEKSLRVLLLRDHRRLGALLAGLEDAFRRDDPADVRDTWVELEEGLRAHLEAEERHLLPLFARVDAAEAAALLSEHAVFRKKLDELGVGVDLHAVSLDATRELTDALRAHAAREERLLYRWADRELGEEERRVLEREIAGEPGGPKGQDPQPGAPQPGKPQSGR